MKNVRLIAFLATASTFAFTAQADANPLLDGLYVAVSGGVTNGSFEGEYEQSGNDFPGDGKGDLEGETFTASIGYDYQLDSNLFVGAELLYRMQDASGSEGCPNPDWSCGFEVKGGPGFRARFGGTNASGTKFYGILGYYQGHATAIVISPSDERFEDEKSVDGIEIGLGVEYPVWQQLSIRGQLLSQGLANKAYEPTSSRDVKAGLATIEIGAVYRF